MPLVIPSRWHAAIWPLFRAPGVCARCGTLYEADPAKQKKPPEVELCGHCSLYGPKELKDANP